MLNENTRAELFEQEINSNFSSNQHEQNDLEIEHAHKSKVFKEALNSIESFGFPHEIASKFLLLVDQGMISNIVINYEEM